MNIFIGKKVPEVVNVLIEIPQGGGQNKYEFDKENGILKLDRVSRSTVVYPANYGFIPQTKYSDGDPLDMIVIGRFPVMPGTLVEARPLGVLELNDSGEDDDKIIGVLDKDPYFDSWKTIEDVPETLKNSIDYFFKTYKELEPGKHIEVKGFSGRDKAIGVIKKSIIK